MQDKLEKERNDAKNAVEEYVYEMRDKLCGVYEKFISEDVSTAAWLSRCIVVQSTVGFSNSWPLSHTLFTQITKSDLEFEEIIVTFLALMIIYKMWAPVSELAA